MNLKEFFFFVGMDIINWRGHLKGEGKSILKNVSAKNIGHETTSTHWAMESQKDLIVQKFFKGFHRESHLYQRIF